MDNDTRGGVKLPGSALLLVLLALSSLLIITTKQWFSASLLYGVALDKEKHEKNFWLLEGFLACSVQLCRRRWNDIQDQLRQEVNSITLIPQSPYNVNARVEITKVNDESLRVHVVMNKKEKHIGEHSCVVTTGTDGTFITEWKEW